MCLTGFSTTATSLVVEQFTRYIPSVGLLVGSSMIVAPISFAGAYYMLKYVLDRLHTVAEEVITYAAQHAGNNDTYDDDK